MKRKIFALITAFALILLLCLSLVACNNDDSDKLPTIRFKDGMTAEEIVEKLEKVENYTLEITSKESTKSQRYMYGKTFWYAEYTHEAIDKRWQFFDGMRFYDIVTVSADGETNSEISIVDYFGYDIIDSVDAFRTDVNFIEALVELANNGEIIIEDGCLIKNFVSGDLITQYIFKDFNKTQMPSVPQKYKNYKKMDATEDVVKYELFPDVFTFNPFNQNANIDNCYFLVYIDRLVKAYEVPETYNGLSVKAIVFDENQECSNLKELRVPESVEMISGEGYWGDLHIIYTGTKEQWEKVSKSIDWDDIRVTCSDGEYSDN